MKVKEQFSDVYTQVDLIDTATVACTAGVWVKLGEVVMSAGQAVSVGYGPYASQETAIGRLYCKLQDEIPGEIHGKLRLSQFSPQGRPGPIIAEYRTNILSSNATDRTKQTPLPEHGLMILEDQRLVLEFLPDTTETLTRANCTLLMDITNYVV